MSQEDLKKEFPVYGTVEESVIITNKFSGRSKGFGFVTFAEDAQAEKAIAELNGKDVGGRQLVVNEAKPMTEERPRREDRSFGGPRSGGFNRGGGGRGFSRSRDSPRGRDSQDF